tara:strand:- start:602 stop:1351 length:750 start_codon:yes stop_codon:yes gene_type:complete
MMEFSSKTALVTGGSRGIGRAICLRLAEEGAAVAVNYQGNRAAAEEVCRLIGEAGGRAIPVQGNVADAEAVSAMVARTESELGLIDLLVCNAGIGRLEGADPHGIENWRHVMAVNMEGVFLPVMAVREGMSERGDGRIVCIASIAGLRPRARNIAYATSKAAVIAFVRNISGVLAPEIRINAVAPGLIETEMIADMATDLKQRLIADTPISRLGRPDEIAEMTLFLLSDKASFTTGQTMVASGGRVTVP